MTVRQYQIVVRATDKQGLTLDELAVHARMHPGLIERLVDLGLITPLGSEGAMLFDPSAVSRLRTIARLRRSFGANLASISVILDLVDKVCALQRENRALRNRS